MRQNVTEKEKTPKRKEQFFGPMGLGETLVIFFGKTGTDDDALLW